MLSSSKQARVKKQSIFSKNASSEESSSQKIPSDVQIDRSCQKQMFKNKFDDDFNKVHVGDKTMSELSFFNEFNNSNLEIPNRISNVQIMSPVGMSESRRGSSNNRRNYDFEESNNEQMYQEENFKVNNENKNQSMEFLAGMTSIGGNRNLKEQQDQDLSRSQQQRSALESQQIVDQEKENKQNNNTNNQPWFKEDMIFEKNLKQLNKQLTQVVKNQLVATNDTQQSKIQQNYQKAAIIVNRLLNTSLNRVMRIRQHTQNFVDYLKNRKNNRRFNDLNQKDFSAINDLSYFYKNKTKKQSTNFFVLRFNKILKYGKLIPVFMPIGMIRVVWDLFQVVFTYLFLYFYSILIFFNQDNPDSDFIKKFFYYAFFVFMTDILVNLNTAYFDKDTIITNRKFIAKQYIFSKLFVTDCISLTVLSAKVLYQSQTIVFNPNHDLLRYAFNILIFLKANGMSPKQQRFHYVFTLKENQKHIIKLVNQIASVITVAHIAAIGWHFVAIQETINGYETSWIEKLGIIQMPYYQKYIYSVYWAITTMTTVGYGDIAATNYVEALFISINMILFSCVFAYSINNIGFILQEIEKSSKELNDNITTIQRYLQRKNVNIFLKSRVRHYLSFLAQESKDRDKKAEDQIISILSNKLRDEITVEINTKILNNYNIFSSNFSSATLKKLVFKMQEVLVSPNEIIFRDEQYEDLSIYFIQNGIIEIYQQHLAKQGQVHVIQTLTDNQSFGEVSFFSGNQRRASARSVNLSTLYKITREDFIEVLKENEEDFERFKMMQEQIQFQNEISILHSECYICRQTGHISRQCPRVHQQFDRQFIVLKKNFSLFQERNNHDRQKTRHKFKAYQFISKNGQICNILKENLENMNSEIYFMFNTNENILDSDYSQTSSEYDDDNEEDEDSQSNSLSDQSSDKSSNKSEMKISKNQAQIKKQSKLLKNAAKHNNENIDREEDVYSESQQQNFVYDNQEQYKQSAKKANSNSLKTTDNENSQLNQDSSSHCEGSEASGNQFDMSHKQLAKEHFHQNNNSGESDQILDEDNIEQHHEPNSRKIIDKKSVVHVDAILDHTDNAKDLVNRQRKSSSNKNNFSSNKKSFSAMKRASNQQSPKPPQGGRFDQKNSIKNLNLDKNFIQKTNDQRSSVEQILIQGIIQTNLINQANRLSHQFNKSQVNNSVSNIQEIIEKSINKSIVDLKKMSYQDLSSKTSHHICSNKDACSQKICKNSQIELKSTDSNQNTQKNLEPISNQNQQQQNQSENRQVQEEEKLVDRFSRLLQNSQIPLLLQYASGMSFRDTTTLNPANSMDYFEKIQFFKKFFPHNNFDQVMSKLKNIQHVFKRQKKRKITQKVRRQNIVMFNQTRMSVINGTSNFIKFIPKDINLDLYKPTYLSYGVGMQKGVTFPINKFNQ